MGFDDPSDSTDEEHGLFHGHGLLHLDKPPALAFHNAPALLNR